MGILLVGFLLLPESECGALLGRAVACAASRRAVRADSQARCSPHGVPVRALPQARTVQRYNTKTLAKQELRRAVSPGSHMTAGARRSRPMSGQHTKQHCGLVRKPNVRETIQLPKGFPVRHNHATSAARGVRELTSPQPLPPQAFKKVVPLPK